MISGNRNFEGRVHPQVRANYLASPMLVVAYALAGSINLDLTKEPVGYDKENEPVYLKDIWPSPKEIADRDPQGGESLQFQGALWRCLRGRSPTGRRSRWSRARPMRWDMDSTYVKNPPYFDGMTLNAARRSTDIKGARMLALFGDSITTDHISPAGNIKKRRRRPAYI